MSGPIDTAPAGAIVVGHRSQVPERLVGFHPRISVAVLIQALERRRRWWCVGLGIEKKGVPSERLNDGLVPVHGGHVSLVDGFAGILLLNDPEDALV